MLDLTQFRVLTFDCYGTLIDWERGILNALRPVLDRHDITMTDDAALELFGDLESAVERGPYKRYHEVLTVVLAGFAERLGFELADDEKHALADSVGDWPAFPDSVEGLQTLAKHYNLVILSNVDDDLFAGSAKRLQTEFSDVITAQQVGSYKPNPRNFEVALERVGVPKEQVLHVAQSLFHDIEPANAIGLTTVWVNRRHDRPGFGATPQASAQPNLEVPDLQTLATMVAEQHG